MNAPKITLELIEAAQAAGNAAHARHWPDDPEAACDAYRDAFLEAMGAFDDPMAPDLATLARDEPNTFGAEGLDNSGYRQV